ncbi:MAG: topoisomerase protein [Candidatus Magasanikbacteria bacterium GW2011_GWA2_56_11]|uniref:DNA topoisomerase 1 n=1 Tax=Candidatus Magasanikbacteria bacterium GW2011_GWA2_56_11 TaxID=1619044 RepID=A0A0G2B7Z4_9BACT|nr:MAG: topoisomerase protein [Candidatus Magasanikbacteria bacterium GW2011_GWA2_56_11]
MPKTLVIVESPTKAKTIAKFLGRGYVVESSFGHVRDLPKSKMGVDTAHGTFVPDYVVPKDKSAQVKKLKDLAQKSESVIFATDEDREGEAISWHLAYILGIPPETAERMVFHEITKTAIAEALAKPRAIDTKLVDAQQARRVLDRLVGYELSPFLWKKVARGLSAGRVQSVAVRLVVEREREIQNFKPEEYWSIQGKFRQPGTTQPEQLISASLYARDGKKLEKFSLANQAAAEAIVSDLAAADYRVADIAQRETGRRPPPPFTTSTLQQAANHKLGYSAKQTMRLAQELYEGVELGEGSVGLITYMRTDSVNLSQKFTSEAADYIVETYGQKYYHGETRSYAAKSKGAQEAHEAIRPTDPRRTPESIQAFLNPRQYKLYDLVWRRAIATQMAEARLNRATIDIAAKTYIFRATGQTMISPGWSALYPEMIKEEMLPEMNAGETVVCESLTPEQHFTEPLPRYSDATLVRKLEEHGIGRPSTYAPTIATIEERHYVERDEQKRLKPTDIAFVVNDLLVEHFGPIVDFEFTAQMEADLDAIAAGAKAWQPVIADFYHPFHANLAEKTAVISKKELTEEATSETCPKCGSPMVIKIGRFGKFMACSNYPECKTTKPIGAEAALESEASGETCPNCGRPMALKRGRFGPFLGCSGYPECKTVKKIEKSTGVKCPQCGRGEFVEKRSKAGRTFYGCNRYPECKNLLPTKPTGELCPECRSPLVFGAKGTVKCSQKGCGYKRSAEEPAVPAAEE